MKLLTLIAIILLVANIPCALAQMNERLAPNEITDLLSGKTAEGTSFEDDFTYTRYFHPDGSVVSRSERKRRTGRWHIDKQDRHCIRWEQSDNTNCSVVVPLESGGFARMRDGKVTHEFRVLDGNQLN